MKSGKVLVEVDGEEVEIANAISEGRRVVLERVVEVVGGFGSERAYLLVASSVPGYEEDGGAS